MSHERILIIDDNPNDIRLMSRVLTRSGYEVLSASSGDEGIERVRETRPDCILVDYRMPGMDGYEVSRQLKKDRDLQSIPVLILTGADSVRDLVDGLDAGADDFVTKSAEMEVIIARVRALLRVKAYQDRIVEQSAQLRRLYDEVKIKSDKILALNERLNKDLQFARRVQEALLPEPVFFGAGTEIRSSYIPSETLSGDFYDYFTVGNSLILFLADVSGHGLPSAILVSLLKSYLHSDTDQLEDLARFMANLNDFLCTASLPSQFATAQLFRYDPTARRLHYCSAAHPPFLLLRPGGTTEVIEQPGHLLGAMPEMRYEQEEITMEPSTLLFTHTDGLTDRRTATGEFYGVERVATLLERRDTDFEGLFRDIQKDVTGFPETDEMKDDIAFVLARTGG